MKKPSQPPQKVKLGITMASGTAGKPTAPKPPTPPAPPTPSAKKG